MLISFKTKPFLFEVFFFSSILFWVCCICIGNSMICSDIWQKYHVQIMLLFVYTTKVL